MYCIPKSSKTIRDTSGSVHNIFRNCHVNVCWWKKSQIDSIRSVVEGRLLEAILPRFEVSPVSRCHIDVCLYRLIWSTLNGLSHFQLWFNYPKKTPAFPFLDFHAYHLYPFVHSTQFETWFWFNYMVWIRCHIPDIPAKLAPYIPKLILSWFIARRTPTVHGRYIYNEMG